MRLDFSNIHVMVAVLVLIFNQFMVMMIVEIINPEWFTQYANLWMSIAYLLTIIYYLKKSTLSTHIMKCHGYIKKGWLTDLGRSFISQLLISVGAYQLLLGMVYRIDSTRANALYQQNTFSYSNQQDLIIGVFCLSILVPICEEILFRGIIFTRLTRYIPLKWSLGGMALLFGLLHGLDLIGATVFGYLCGLLYIKYKTLWAPIILHIINNGMSCLLHLYELKMGIVAEELTSSFIHHQMLTGSLYLIGGLVFLKWCHTGLKKD